MHNDRDDVHLDELMKLSIRTKSMHKKMNIMAMVMVLQFIFMVGLVFLKGHVIVSLL